MIQACTNTAIKPHIRADESMTRFDVSLKRLNDAASTQSNLFKH